MTRSAAGVSDCRYFVQTETGGILITPLPGATLLKPGSATGRSSASSSKSSTPTATS